MSGQITLGPNDSLKTLPINFSNSIDFTLNGGTVLPTNITLSGEIQLTDDSFVIRPQNPLVRDSRGNLIEQILGPTNFNGPIVGPAGLTFTNQSRDLLVIGGDNTYDGQTFLEAGQIVATSSTAFGSTAGSTTLRRGELTVQAATDEQFRIEGGVLRFDAGDFAPTGPLSITGGEVFLPQRDLYTLEAVVGEGDATGGTLRFGFDDSASWTGGSSGVGNLTLVGRVNVDSPLTHDGDLTIDGVRLNVANTYTGRTIITDTFTIDRADVFGTSTSQIEIDEATVTVNVVPDGGRGFNISRGSLDVQTTQPIEGPITLGGDFSATIRGDGTFNGPIDYVTTRGGGNAQLSSGTFNGAIRGDTELRLGSANQTVTLNAANDINGSTIIRGGTVIANHAEAINLPNTSIQGGTLELNTPATQSALIEGGVLQLNVDQQIDETVTIDAGTIAAAGNVSFQKLRLLADISSRTSDSADASRALAVDGGSIEIAGEAVAFGRNEIGGKIVGDGVIRAAIQSDFSGDLNLSGDFSEFTGSIVADRGGISFGRSTTGFTTDFSINPDVEIHVFEGGRIFFTDDDQIIENDIFLHNTGGAADSTPGIIGRSNETRTLAGRVDVGQTGSTISDSFNITGELTGSNLTVRNGFLNIQSAQDELAGTLRLNNGSVLLSGAGRLDGLDEILLERNARVSLSLNGDTDVVDNETRFRSRGGSISLTSGSQPTSETIGTLQLERGETALFASSDHGNASATLTFDRLERNVGTLLEFRDAGPEATFEILDTERFETTGERMLGGWATFNGQFASIDADGKIGQVSLTETSINEAGANDHIRTTVNQVLESDKEVASLQSFSRSFDLGGHKLTVRSGGILSSPAFDNGQLTAGDGDAAAELFFHRGSSVSADIVDNGENGSVSVVVGNDNQDLRFSGANTYSGGTYILGELDITGVQDRGRLTIDSLSAIPENDRVFVNGGHYQLSIDEPGTVKLDELHVRNNAFISGGSNNPFDIDNLFLEDGNFQAGLTGDGTIFKDSGGDVTFSGSSITSPSYTGQIVVRDGSLSFNRPDQLSNAQIRVEGGEFKIPDFARAFNNDIHLDGGALSGGQLMQGDVFVDSDSTLIANGFNTNLFGRLIGDDNLTIQGSLRNYTSSHVGIFGDASEFQGDIDIQSGALRIGTPGSLGDGEITIQEGGRLVLGSSRETDPATSIDNTIHIRGGSLISVPPRRFFDGVAPPSFATGDVHIHTDAYIGAIYAGNTDGEFVPALTFSGRLILEDNAEIYGVSEGRVVNGDQPLTAVSGELLVGAQTSWTWAPRRSGYQE